MMSPLKYNPQWNRTAQSRMKNGHFYETKCGHECCPNNSPPNCRRSVPHLDFTHAPRRSSPAKMPKTKWQMANGKWQRANAKRQTPNAKCQMPNAKCQIHSPPSNSQKYSNPETIRCHITHRRSTNNCQLSIWCVQGILGVLIFQLSVILFWPHDCNQTFTLSAKTSARFLIPHCYAHYYGLYSVTKTKMSRL